ncbi:unnamed protein product [Camellia sinensis]
MGCLLLHFQHKCTNRRRVLEFLLVECTRACHPITEVYDSFLGANALNACGDFVIADNEIFG